MKDMKVTKDIIYVNVNDHELDLFKGQYILFDVFFWFVTKGIIFKKQSFILS